MRAYIRTISAAAVGLLLAWCRCADALDPSLDVSQYGHTAWKIRDGFSRAPVTSMAQTPDGYLWLGTPLGLLRFDGVRAMQWQTPSGGKLPSEAVFGLLVDRQGALWIGTDSGLARWRSGHLVEYPALAGSGHWPLIEDRKGTIWVGGFGAPYGAPAELCAIRGEVVTCYRDDGRFGQSVNSAVEDASGDLWVSATTGLWRWNPKRAQHYGSSGSVGKLLEGDGGAILCASRNGLLRVAEDGLVAYQPPGFKQPVSVLTAFRDHDGSLWIGTADRGLLHVHDDRTDAFARPDGLSGDRADYVFEDKEGNIWVATHDGLDRFRNIAIPTISVAQGLSHSLVLSVLATKESIWMATQNGLDRWVNNQISIYRGPGAPISRGDQSVKMHGINVNALQSNNFEALHEDERGRVWVSTTHGVGFFDHDRFFAISSVPPATNVWSVVQTAAGSVWISQDDGLYHLQNDVTVEKFSSADLQRSYTAIAMLAVPSGGGLWLGFQDGGVAYFKDGRIEASYAEATGLGKGTVEQLRLGPDGAVWAATQGGLSRISDGHVATLASHNGLPCDAVHWSMEDDDRSVWLYMPCGLVRIARTDIDAWMAYPGSKVDPTVFDENDGVRVTRMTSWYNPQVTKSVDGRLWFVAGDGVGVIDPRHLAENKILPPVHVESIVADRKTYEASSRVRLPPLVRDLEVDYTALSLVAPDKNRFRYKLEGRDHDWQSVGNRRQAFYNDLPPGNYRFRVVASNNSGVWNEQGAALDFSIAPAYWQTMWFRAVCVVASLLVLWGLYQLRLRQIAQAFNTRLEERVAERTRIARDLHDTLLQSFQGLLLRFQMVRELLRMRPSEADKMLESAIDQTAQAITEGRNAVQGLRSSTLETNDLAEAITFLGKDLAAETNDRTPVGLQVDVEGSSRTLHPIVRDEIYRIASEALRNAFRHAEAKQIEVEIRYDDRHLRLRVRDDGKGIDPKVLSGEGREGHFGLPGMRERAKLIGGKLTVWTAPGSGTEIEFSVPASHAYARAARPTV